jgi:hypothetical protein
MHPSHVIACSLDPSSAHDRIALTIDDRGVALEVAAPTDARTTLDDIFGPDATEPR